MINTSNNTKGFRNILIIYLISIILGNLLVYWVGPPGILITSFIFIPFDFIIRCYLHELYRGKKLYLMLLGIVILGGVCTYLINIRAQNIALASVAGFVSATGMGSFIYQFTIRKSSMIKVNLSDIAALILDSIVFQSIAFNHINYKILVGQIAIKISGGLAWYWVLIHKAKLIEKIKQASNEVIFEKYWTKLVGHSMQEQFCYISFRGTYYLIMISFFIHSNGCIAQIYEFKTDKYEHEPIKTANWQQLFEARISVVDADHARKRAITEAKKLIIPEGISSKFINTVTD